MQPRGLRNNNPLNIRIGNAWLGEVAHPTDQSFEQFVSMEYGIRAALVLIKRYMQRYRLTTPSLIVSRWAPSSENNTDAYVRVVTARSGLGAHSSFSFAEKEKVVALVCAMAYVENGQEIDADLVRHVYDNIASGKYSGH